MNAIEIRKPIPTRLKPSPIHPAVDELVNVLCAAASNASLAEKALRIPNHQAAAQALQDVALDLQRCNGIVPVALWECCKRGGAGRKMLKFPPASISRPKTTALGQ
ncbi:MAG: hypothetical protein PHE83_17440 [Opitutaceae bacterium]|nr:hypothetical protein [Opitutaceae bacterium]